VIGTQASPLQEVRMNISRVEILTPAIEARIHGVDLSLSLNDADIAEIRRLLVKHGVIFFEDQYLTPVQHLDLAKRFGEIAIHPTYKQAPDAPGLAVLDTGSHNPTDNNIWHTDMTFRPDPPMASMLYSLMIPPQGGDTLWSDMRSAYRALSKDIRTLLDPLDAEHDFKKAFPPDNPSVIADGLENYEKAKRNNPPVLHPVVRTHLESDEDCLFVNENFTTAIRGLPKEQGDALLKFLYIHIQQPQFVVRWRWKPYTIGFWDNRSTQHYAVDDYRPFRRIMHRATIKGDRPYNRSRRLPGV
jgi:taurine dioxygenase